MDSKIIQATVTTVPLGNIEIEGLLLETGGFAITVQQVATLFQVPQNNAQRDLKTLLGKGLRFLKIRVKNAGARKPENSITLPEFEKVMFELALKGNTVAVGLSRALIGLSLTQVFSDSFDIKFDKEDRQNYLIARQEGKHVRRKLTDAIKAWCDKNNVPEKVKGYCVYCSDAINLHLFGKKSSELKAERSVPAKDLLRDYLTHEELRALERLEDRVILLSDMMDVKPTDAVKTVLSATR